jgi:hypothetical protein
MAVWNKMKALWSRATKGRFLLVMLCASLAQGQRAYAQTQTQPANAHSAQMSATPGVSEISPEVAKELQAVKARMTQMELQLKNLAAFEAAPTGVVVPSASFAPTEVTLTGTLSCGHCQGIQPMHKGYTQFSWALNSVSQGDDIVLVGHDQGYKLRGDKDSCSSCRLRRE